MLQSDEPSMTQGWIIKDKLPGFVELLAFIAGAKNDWDLEVIVSGLHGTDD
ncbi:hypothetical protein [Botrimarina mediterranea]|uniref:hypothetical protein n=1 Tax=Botrimarina mediterranea TaxID=2528022 RepID=UPI0018D32F64